MTEQEVLAREQNEQEAKRLEAWNQFVARRGDRYANCRLKTFVANKPEQKAVVERLEGYCANIKKHIEEGEGLILFGPKGTGKDHLASAVARAAIHAGGSVSWVNGMDLFGDVRDRMEAGEAERAFVQQLIRPNVLYISDPLPPVGPLTPFQAQMLFRVLDGRYSRCRPCWVTINVKDRNEFDERMGAQNADRLRDGAIALHCNWDSYRRTR